MTDLRTPKAPCEIRELVEAFAVIDADGRAVSFVYFAEGARLAATGRWSQAEARAIAERIARGFTKAAERDKT